MKITFFGKYCIFTTCLPTFRCFVGDLFLTFRHCFFHDFLEANFQDFSTKWSPKRPPRNVYEAPPGAPKIGTLAQGLPLRSRWLVLAPAWLHFGRPGHPSHFGSFSDDFWSKIMSSWGHPSPQDTCRLIVQAPPSDELFSFSLTPFPPGPELFLS